MKLELQVAVCVIALICHTGCTSKVTAPSRPSVVPSVAVWAGGVDGGSFFECDTDTTHNVNRCLVYNDHTGDVEGGGFFRLADTNRAATRDELRFQFFGGEDRIELEGHTLVRVQPVRPIGLPHNAVLTNGLFISCGQIVLGSTDCSVYRPDGSTYFRGRFLADTGTPKLEYKFFDLSDRTIYLVGGGTLVAE